MASKLSIKDQILQKSNIETTSFHVKAWGVDITIKKLTIKERNEVDAVMYGNSSIEDMKHEKLSITPDLFYKVSVKAVSYSVVEEDGSQMFSEDELYSMSDTSRDAISEIYTALEGFDKPKK